MQYIKVNPRLALFVCPSSPRHAPDQTACKGFVRFGETRPSIHPRHNTTRTKSASSIGIGAVIDDLGSQLAFGVQLHQVIPAADHGDRNGERVPHVLADDFEVKRAQRPDWTARHAAVAGDDGHDAVLDHEAGQGRQLVGELFFFAAPF